MFRINDSHHSYEAKTRTFQTTVRTSWFVVLAGGRMSFLMKFMFIIILSDVLMGSTSEAATYTVTNLNNSGSGSLRQAILDANANTVSDDIAFSVSGTVGLTSPLPPLTDDGTVIDASSQWSGSWPGGAPGITLDGSSILQYGPGIEIDGASNCEVYGLYITDFNTHGVYIHNGGANNTIGGAGMGQRNVLSGNANSGVYIGESTTDNLIQCNYIGVDVTGSSSQGNYYGVYLYFAADNTIGGATSSAGNVISANSFRGIYVYGNSATGNLIRNNIIGLDAGGTVDLGNGIHGIDISNGSNTTTIESNVVSGNNNSGIVIQGGGAGNNILTGNYIGTDYSGMSAVGNNFYGVIITEGSYNTVGGSTPSARNVISGNTHTGVAISSSSTSDNLIHGNYIGTDVTGSSALGNGTIGVGLFESSDNTVGGSSPGDRNIISGNGDDGVHSWGPASNNIIQGNYIGLDATGTTDIGNEDRGVYLYGSVTAYQITDNVISGNDSCGIHLQDAGTSGHVITGNYIGTDLTGSSAVGNNGSGIAVQLATNNTIGGDTTGERNVVSGNGYHGIYFGLSGTSDNMIYGNFIGPATDGTSDAGNGGSGIYIDGSLDNTIGGTSAGEGNCISGNGSNGISIRGSGTNTLSILGNTIGLDVTGDIVMPNDGSGIDIFDTPSTTIGGTVGGSRNIISGNVLHGINVHGSGADDTIIEGNYIGIDEDGEEDLGNGRHGILFDGGTQRGIVLNNVVSGNDSTGIHCRLTSDAFHEIKGNQIGIDATCLNSVGNGTGGIYLSGTDEMTIGGATAQERNVISGNIGYGIRVSASYSGTMRGNFIGTDASGTASIPNGDGVFFDFSNDWAIQDNLISGNDGEGITLVACAFDTLYGNCIGTDMAGTADMGNSGHGLLLSDSDSVCIGGANMSHRNVIAGNDSSGIKISNSGETTGDHLIQGNHIGVNGSGTAIMPNEQHGISVINSGGNIIGGSNTGEGNIVSGNGQHGIYIAGEDALGTIILGNWIGTNSADSMFGNGSHGMCLALDAMFTSIGLQDVGNTIAYNGSDGICVTGAGTIANTISRNSIYGNGGLGIDLDSDGVSPNDGGDLDSGANNLQNFPVITSIVRGAGSMTITGTLNSSQNQSYVIEIFSNSTVDPSYHGEGATFLDTIRVDTGSSVLAPFSKTISTVLTDGSWVTATTTAGEFCWDTSEFSEAFYVHDLVLTGTELSGTLELSWNAIPDAAAYWVFGESNNAFFEPDMSPSYINRIAIIPSGTTHWSTSAGNGDSGNNWTFQVIAMGSASYELCGSNRAGEFDFDLP